MSKKESHYINNYSSQGGGGPPGIPIREGAVSAVSVTQGTHSPLLMTVNTTTPSGRRVKNQEYTSSHI